MSASDPPPPPPPNRHHLHPHHHTVHSTFNATPWSFHENKLFEQALANTLLINSPDLSSSSSSSSSLLLGLANGIDQIACMVPGKSVSQVKRHYDLLLHDLASIESGLILPPPYDHYDGNRRFRYHPGGHDVGKSGPFKDSTIVDESEMDDLYKDDDDDDDDDGGGGGGDDPAPPALLPPPLMAKTNEMVKSNGPVGRPYGRVPQANLMGSSMSKVSSDQERKKGIPWTEEEHRLFLLGLDKFGKGDWRSISRNFVVSRTPTQVASHAQKYFIRLTAINKDKRRSSIHDITSPAPATTTNTNSNTLNTNYSNTNTTERGTIECKKRDAASAATTESSVGPIASTTIGTARPGHLPTTPTYSSRSPPPSSPPPPPPPPPTPHSSRPRPRPPLPRVSPDSSSSSSSDPSPPPSSSSSISSSSSSLSSSLSLSSRRHLHFSSQPQPQTQPQPPPPPHYYYNHPLTLPPLYPPPPTPYNNDNNNPTSAPPLPPASSLINHPNSSFLPHHSTPTSLLHHHLL